jgi:hypothetical protein
MFLLGRLVGEGTYAFVATGAELVDSELRSDEGLWSTASFTERLHCANASDTTLEHDGAR